MLPQIILAIIWMGITAYAIFAGADFGAGLWDLFAGGPAQGRRPRGLLERSIGPVWEANHVWLIFVLVYLWTAFPEAFVSIMTTMYIPMMFAGLGIVFRGSAFAFRKWAPSTGKEAVAGTVFAGASLLTPFFLGAVAGGVASGRVPLGNAAGNPWSSWINPTSMLAGLLAVVACAYIAAVLVARDADRSGFVDLAEYFRLRALGSGVVVGFVALGGTFVVRFDAPTLYEGLTRPVGVLVVSVSAVAGILSLLSIYQRRTQLSRVLAIVATSSILWGWAVGQCPWLLPDVLLIEDGAAPDAVLIALLVAFVAAAALAIPSLLWLLSLTDRGFLDADQAVRDGSSEALLASLTGDSTAKADDA